MSVTDDLKQALKLVGPNIEWARLALEVLSSDTFHAASNEPGSGRAGSLADTFAIRAECVRDAGVPVFGVDEVVESLRRLPSDTRIDVLATRSDHYLVQGFRVTNSDKLLGCLVLKRLKSLDSWRDVSDGRP